MKARTFFLLIPLSLLFHVLFSATDLSVTSTKDFLTHHSRTGVMSVSFGDGETIRSGSKTIKKNPTTDSYLSSSVTFVFFPGQSLSVPFHTHLISLETFLRTLRARAPPAEFSIVS